MTKPPASDAERANMLLQAVSNQYGMLQSARGATISESSRSSLYLTSLTGAVVGLSFVAQASRFGETFFIFAIAILPVVFFLGLVDHAALFNDSSVDQVGLSRLGTFRLWWQQFLSAAAMIAIVNSVVGGGLIALAAAYMLPLAPAVTIGVGSLSALLIALGFLRHQWLTWMRVAKALPMTT